MNVSMDMYICSIPEMVTLAVQVCSLDIIDGYYTLFYVDLSSELPSLSHISSLSRGLQSTLHRSEMV